MPKQKKRQKPQAPARFKIGDRVRVRQGIVDDEYPDIPLGGWAGTVVKIDRRRLCLIRWSAATLVRIHPVYKKRCRIGGKAWDEYSLPQDELEADPGGPPVVQQPVQVVPRLLSPKNQGDRVRMVFGLTSDDFLPEADEESLETYYDYLAQRLSLPMWAKIWDEDSPFHLTSRSVKIAALDHTIAWDDGNGIYAACLDEAKTVVPLGDLEIPRSHPNFQLIDDYTEWFVGNLAEDDEDADDEDLDEEDFDDDSDDTRRESIEVAMVGVAGSSWHVVAVTTLLGAVSGPLLATIVWAKWGAVVGATIVGLVSGMEQARAEQGHPFRRIRQINVGFFALIGVCCGVMFGAMAVACVGSMLGFVAWLLLERFCRRVVKRPLAEASSVRAVVAAAAGAIAEAFYFSPQAAANGLCNGAVIGLGCGLFFMLAVRVLIWVLPKDMPYRVYLNIAAGSSAESALSGPAHQGQIAK